MQKGINAKKLQTIIACVVVQICVGILYLWSIFRKSVVEFYSWSEGASTMVSPVMLTAFVLGNLIGGYLQDKTNPRLVAAIGAATFSVGVFLTSFLTKSTINLIFVTYCALGGLGCGFAYASILSCLQKWFPKRRGFAAGIAVASFSASTVVFGPVSQILLGLSAFGEKSLPYTFLTLSIVFFIFSMLAAAFIRLPKENDLEIVPASNPQTLHNHTLDNTEQGRQSESSEQRIKEQGQDGVHGLVEQSKDTEQGQQSESSEQGQGAGLQKQPRSYTPLEAMKTLPFWCIALTLFFINGTWNMVVPLIKDLGMNRGLSETAAVAAVTITGVTNTLGRFSMATVSDKIGRAFTVIILAIVTAISALLLIFAGGYFYLAIIALLAFCYGGPSSTLPAMTTDLYGTKYGGTNYGIAMLGLGLSSIVFNLLSILINNQTISFIMGAVTGIIAAALMLASYRLSKKHKNK